MSAFLRPLLLVAALLFSQHAAVLHGLAHAQHDLALATQPEGKAPALDHDLDTCAAFAALAGAIGNAFSVPAGDVSHAGVQPASFSSFVSALRVAFDSRAPPLSA